jgi:hypothetical protein
VILGLCFRDGEGSLCTCGVVEVLAASTCLFRQTVAATASTTFSIVATLRVIHHDGWCSSVAALYERRGAADFGGHRPPLQGQRIEWLHAHSVILSSRAVRQLPERGIPPTTRGSYKMD